MKIQLVYFEGCPNVDAARDAIRRSLKAADQVPHYEEVDTGAPSTPESLRGWGSPTILVGGVDVGGEPEPSGTSCRLYDNPENRGVPSDEAIIKMRGDLDGQLYRQGDCPMKALIAVVAAASVLVQARSAWACGECFGDGSTGSVLGWIVLGSVGLLVYRLMRKP